jgi:hypothetical protein
MRLCSFVVRNDIGLAPNPFHGYCTVAITTPNQMGLRAQPGDWLMGTQPVHKGEKLIFAMEISEIMSLHDYYQDPRFEQKKPVKDGNQIERVGDNMYYQDENGEWQQHPTRHHTSRYERTQDTKHPSVFIAEHFYYLGENAVELPVEFQPMIRRRHGCKCAHEPELVQDFLKWLAETYEPGVHGDPGDWPRRKIVPEPVIYLKDQNR